MIFMEEYEYVSKKEYRPIEIQLEQIIKKVQNIVRDDFTFQFRLCGSVGRKVVTRIKGGNKGFDFDYNLILNNPDEEHYWKPKFAKETLLNAFREAVKGTSFSDPEDSTSVITIKAKDKTKSRILYSADFAVIYYENDNNDRYYKYIRRTGNQYTWEIRELSRNIDAKYNWLKENVEDYWDDIKEEYLKVKNSNQIKDKHSYVLYMEAINNLYNHYQQCYYSDDDDDYYDDYDDDDEY